MLKKTRNSLIELERIPIFRVMKSKKNKVSRKLESLKEDESLAEDQNLLDEDIGFDKDEGSGSAEAEPPPKRDSTQVYVTGGDYDEGTAVLPEHSKDGHTMPVAVAGDSNETTHREITAGRNTQAEVEKVSYGDVYENDGNGPRTDTVEGLLKQTEHLRLAQEKINDLESEIEDLRRENDELLSAADTFKVLSEDYHEQLERLKIELVESREISSQELKILKESLVDRDRQANELKQTNADLKAKVETNFKQIRKRERDLEYRLELVKVEEATLLKTKDKSILELRRKVDKLEQEMEAYRDKNKEHYQKLQQQQQTVRGVVRALRIALTRLEGDFGVDLEVLKKAE